MHYIQFAFYWLFAVVAQFAMDAQFAVGAQNSQCIVPNCVPTPQ